VLPFAGLGSRIGLSVERVVVMLVSRVGADFIAFTVAGLDATLLSVFFSFKTSGGIDF
jgi:hypothetical protein